MTVWFPSLFFWPLCLLLFFVPHDFVFLVIVRGKEGQRRLASHPGREEAGLWE